ncbi:MAG TPA: iron ABC transporter substrate-binding protein [Casimicrobiaceae bacterium]|nr:iron ABC transporter substrate-binding protein [Casimicrobiaceae bacterium]
MVDRVRRRLVAAGVARYLVGAARGQKGDFTDDAGRIVAVPSRVERIFAAGPPASVLVFAAAPTRLLGWTTPFRDDERPFVDAKYANLPTLGRLTGRGNTANVEVVLAAKPDLIVDYGAVTPTFASLAERVERQTGIPYVLLDGSFDRMTASIRRFGRLVEADAETLAHDAEQTVAQISRRVAAIPAESRPRVYYGRGPLGLQTGLAGSINVESIERVGAINVAAELGRGGLVQVSVEQVLRWDPDVIVTTDPNFELSLRDDPRWRGLSAVRKGRFHLAPAVPFGWIDFPPSLNRLIGLRWLARVLYPESFPEDLRPAVRTFYGRYYHRVPTDAQIDMLLASMRTRS